VDGEMNADTAATWGAHLAECAHCARYDRILRRGIKTLSIQPQLLPTSEFMSQLHQRLLAEDRRVVRPLSSLTTATVAVAAMLAFAAWLPVMILAGEEKQAVEVAAREAASAVATEIAWHAESAVEARSSGHVHLARREAWLPSAEGHVIEARYTPVVLESPIAPLSSSRTYRGAE
jgi:hypothetical protein